jgi:hypothetical protein
MVQELWFTDMGFRVKGLRLRVRVKGLRFRVHGLGLGF